MQNANFKMKKCKINELLNFDVCILHFEFFIFTLCSLWLIFDNA